VLSNREKCEVLGEGISITGKITNEDIYIYIYIYIWGVSGGIVNILGGGSMDYSE